VRRLPRGPGDRAVLGYLAASAAGGALLDSFFPPGPRWLALAVAVTAAVLAAVWYAWYRCSPVGQARQALRSGRGDVL
jgi:H+/gluconate symporter-like permease